MNREMMGQRHDTNYNCLIRCFVSPFQILVGPDLHWRVLTSAILYRSGSRGSTYYLKTCLSGSVFWFIFWMWDHWTLIFVLKNKTETIYCFPVVPITFIMNIPKVLLQICRSVESPFQIVVGPDLHWRVLTSVILYRSGSRGIPRHIIWRRVCLDLCFDLFFFDVRALDFDIGV